MEVIVIRNNQLANPIQGYSRHGQVLIAGQIVVVPTKITMTNELFSGEGLIFEIDTCDAESFDSKSFIQCHDLLAKQYPSIREKIYDVLELNRYMSLSLLILQLGLTRERTKELLKILIQHKVVEKYHTYWRRSIDWMQWFDNHRRQAELLKPHIEHIQQAVVKKKETLADMMHELGGDHD